MAASKFFLSRLPTLWIIKTSQSFRFLAIHLHQICCSIPIELSLPFFEAKLFFGYANHYKKLFTYFGIQKRRPNGYIKMKKHMQNLKIRWISRSNTLNKTWKNELLDKAKPKRNPFHAPPASIINRNSFKEDWR